MGGFLRPPVGHAVEPVEHRHAEPVVEAVALDLGAVVAGDRVDIAVIGALHQHVGEHVPPAQHRRLPAEIELRAAGRVAKGIGGLLGQADEAAGLVDRGAVGQRLEKGHLLRRRPAGEPLRRALRIFMERRVGRVRAAGAEGGRRVVCRHGDGPLGFV